MFCSLGANALFSIIFSTILHSNLVLGHFSILILIIRIMLQLCIYTKRGNGSADSGSFLQYCEPTVSKKSRLLFLQKDQMIPSMIHALLNSLKTIQMQTAFIMKYLAGRGQTMAHILGKRFQFFILTFKYCSL